MAPRRLRRPPIRVNPPQLTGLAEAMTVAETLTSIEAQGTSVFARGNCDLAISRRVGTADPDREHGCIQAATLSFLGRGRVAAVRQHNRTRDTRACLYGAPRPARGRSRGLIPFGEIGNRAAQVASPRSGGELIDVGHRRQRFTERQELEPILGAQLRLQVAHDSLRALEARGPCGIEHTHAARNVDQDG